MRESLKKQHAQLITRTLKCFNIYSSIQTTSIQLNGYEFSLVDLQILSALYPNKTNQYNMTTISNELGIAPSTFSKSVAKLTKLGLMEKYHKNNNKKNIIVWLSPEGEEYYTEILKCHDYTIEQFIQKLDLDPLRIKYYLEFLETMETFLQYSINDNENDVELIPVKEKD